MTKVVAEYGQTMKGSLDVAHKQVEVAAAAGCWGYKTQLLNPSTIARPDAELYWQHGQPARSQRDAFRQAGLVPFAAWQEVAVHARRLSMEFVATPFDLAAVEAMASWETFPVFKVASGDLTNVPLLRAIANAYTEHTRGLHPLIVSTGASYLTEVLEARRVLNEGGIDDEQLIWLACTLAYPTKPDDAELGRITTLRVTAGQYLRRVGYSDHVGLCQSALGAAVLGAELLEVHCTLDPGEVTGCADDVHGLGPYDLGLYRIAAEAGAGMIGSGNLEPIEAEQPARLAARRSICARHDLPVGRVLTAADLICLRPGDGLSPTKWDQVLGSRVLQPIRAGAAIDPALILFA